MLGPRHRLPTAPKRVFVTGNPGSGRTATAARIGVILSLPTSTAADDAWAMPLSRPDAELAERADTLVWLDFPASVWVGRLVQRAIRGHESWRSLGEAWRGRREVRTMVLTLDAEHRHTTVVRLRSQADVERWLAGLPRPDERP